MVGPFLKPRAVRAFSSPCRASQSSRHIFPIETPHVSHGGTREGFLSFDWKWALNFASFGEITTWQ